MKTKNIFMIVFAFALSIIMATPVFAQKKHKTADEKLLDAIHNLSETNIRVAIDKGANLFMKDSEGRNLLMLLVKDLRLKTVYEPTFTAPIVYIDDAHRGNIADQLIDLGIDKNDVDDDGNTALMYAAENGYYEVVKTLVRRDAKVDAVNNDNDSALTKTLRQHLGSNYHAFRVSPRKYIKIVKTLAKKDTKHLDEAFKIVAEKAITHLIDTPHYKWPSVYAPGYPLKYHSQIVNYCDDIIKIEETLDILIKAGAKKDIDIYNAAKKKYEELFTNSPEDQHRIEFREALNRSKRIMKMLTPKEEEVKEQIVQNLTDEEAMAKMLQNMNLFVQNNI